ncbi:MAG: glycosyltransferase [Candidatus Hydrogenedentota bacterium]
MRVLQVHNRYRLRGGEETVVENTLDMLNRRGVAATLFDKASADVGGGLTAKVRAVFSAIYAPSSRKEMHRLLEREQPDIVHVHNLYPLISPSVLAACREAGVPAVMTVHNYRLICPIAVHFRDGRICTECASGREWNCAVHNCRGNRIESAAYALRNWTVRRLGLYRKNVTLYLAISQFLKDWLVAERLPANRVVVTPNMITLPSGPIADAGAGAYAGFAGRASAEKGIDVLIEAARQAPGVPVTIAGHGPLLARFKANAPENVHFPGMLSREGLAGFYQGLRFLVVPSVWYETFGLVACEAMSHGIPVIASKIGGLQEIVRNGETGLHFEPGNAEDLAEKMRALWNDPDRCRTMGQAGRALVEREYSEPVYFENLMAAYEQARTLGGPPTD